MRAEESMIELPPRAIDGWSVLHFASITIKPCAGFLASETGVQVYPRRSAINLNGEKFIKATTTKAESNNPVIVRAIMTYPLLQCLN